tara:strand:- start:732 stop:848 length:117 start_codon:yes stop_codon:yes gene_type:complete
MNVLDMAKLRHPLTCDFAVEGGKKNNCQDKVYKIELIE